MSGNWAPLDPRITSRVVEVRDLKIHLLEALPSNKPAELEIPLVVLLHGFPELSYSWRKILVPLANLGYHVVAPDQRGYGKTVSKFLSTVSQNSENFPYDEDSSSLAPFRMVNLAHDIVALVHVLGYSSAKAVIGHDFGSPVAAHCALIRPDIFKSVVLMSAPYTGPPAPTPELTQRAQPAKKSDKPDYTSPFWFFVDHTLASADPPLKHYTTYSSSSKANDDMLNSPQGLPSFLRAYYHMKSADWAGNDTHPISTKEFSHLPPYYIMPFSATMPEVVHEHAPSSVEVDRNGWLTDAELQTYVNEFGRTGFQGALNWYRSARDARYEEEMGIYAGRKIEIPAMFVGGKRDWGVYQNPGGLQKMQREVFTKMQEGDVVLIEGAGHWVQQEQPKEVLMHLEAFLNAS